MGECHRSVRRADTPPTRQTREAPHVTPTQLVGGGASRGNAIHAPYTARSPLTSGWRDTAHAFLKINFLGSSSVLSQQTPAQGYQNSTS